MSHRRLAALLILFGAFTIVVTYPQVTGMRTLVPFHSDPYFSMWRLGWVAHQIPQGWRALFDANIFFPEPYTLAYSDAMLLPGIALAPLFWLGISPVTIYNSTLLGAMALSGVAACVLVRQLTGSQIAGIVSGTIYAFAPYRFDHYMHLELQIVFWMPLALLVLHRTIDRPRVKDAVLLGSLVAAQALSCIYAGLFFGIYAAAVASVLVLLAPDARVRRTVALWTSAAAVAALLTWPYAAAYSRAQESVGTRSLDSARYYSATSWSYRSTPPVNRLFGQEGARPGAPELYLFPGYAALLLAGLGIACSRDRRRLAYVAGLLIAVEISRGVNGFAFPWLYEHVTVFRALRVPSRVAILANLSIAVLGGYGAQWLTSWSGNGRWARVFGAAAVAAILCESASAPVLSAAPQASRIDHWLAKQPPSVIVELPLASQRRHGSLDWLYMYQGIEHRQRMLNGYSGFAPDTYYSMLDRMAGFPDDRSMDLLRERRVDFVVLRGEEYPIEDWDPLVAAARARSELSLVTILPYQGRFQAVFAVRR